MNVLAAREPIIDTHVHLWDLAHPKLTWNWVDTPDDHPILGNIDQVKMQAFTMRALEAEAKTTNAQAFVHVQAAIGSADPVDETRWLEATAGDVLDAHLAASPRYRGTRDFAVEPWLASGVEDAGMEAGLRELAKRGLLLDLDCEYPNMAAAARMAARHPELAIVLEHIGFPRRRDDDYFQAWQAAIKLLAQQENVVCKISGIAMTDPDFTLDSLRPWVLTCVSAFGPERCMIGSNWPLDRMFSSYPTIIDVYRELLSELSGEEQHEVLCGTANRVYSLNLDL